MTRYITTGCSILSGHNKVFGMGLASIVVAKVTIRDTFFNSTNNRNLSVDNLTCDHLYNNYCRNILPQYHVVKQLRPRKYVFAYLNLYHEGIFGPVVEKPANA